jgi:hypothetical protein
VAGVAGLPAASETLAVMETLPSVSALTWAELSETVQAPPEAIVPLVVLPPTLTLALRPSAPVEVPAMVSHASSSVSLT